MSFLLIAFAVAVIIISLRKYRRWYTAGAVILFLFTATTTALIYGLIYFRTEELIRFFNLTIPKKGFIHAVILWYGVDIFCAAVIIRNYREYLSVNKG